MDTTKKPDLKMNGIGSAPGGEYNVVRMNGHGTIDGDVTCEDFAINGAGDAKGAVTAGRLHINGVGSIFGAVKADKLAVRGSADFFDSVQCEDAAVSGKADCKKDMRADRVKISGAMYIHGDCSAEKFTSCGKFEVAGLLNADTIDVTVDIATSRAREIGGENISVKTGTATLSVLRKIFTLGTHRPNFETDFIEGNEIYLESTYAKAVRGNNITIGEGCDIGLVEYKGVLRKVGSCRIREERKL